LNIFKLEVVQKEDQLVFLTKREISGIRQVFQAFALDINRITKVNRQYLWACFPTARSPTSHYFGWRLGGVTFNLWSVFCVRSLKRVRSVEKMTSTARKKGFLCVVGWEDILRWNGTLKPCSDRIDLQGVPANVDGRGQ
jgi:hypothetical protein